MKLFSKMKEAILNKMPNAYAMYKMLTPSMGVKGEVTNKIIGVAVALFICAIVLPIGINELLRAENSDWGVINTLVTVLLPVLAVLAIVRYFMKK